MKTLLHVGCGFLTIQALPSFFHDGEWEELRVDIDPGVGPDIVASLQDLSILEDGAMNAVYSSHNIEHVWEFEVAGVMREFYRVTADKGFALILCPDLQSVAQAVLTHGLHGTLYESGVGPISANDILYGHGAALAAGRHFMAHKTGFTADSLGSALRMAGFSNVFVARDNFYGLHAVAFKSIGSLEAAEGLANRLMPAAEYVLEAKHFD